MMSIVEKRWRSGCIYGCVLKPASLTCFIESPVTSRLLPTGSATAKGLTKGVFQSVDISETSPNDQHLFVALILPSEEVANPSKSVKSHVINIRSS